MGETGKILILGGTGMLGHVLLRYFGTLTGYEVYATSRDSAKLPGLFPEGVSSRFIPGNLDADDPEHIIAVIQKVRPFLVINCIGIIKQLPAANDPVISIRINALFPHLVARACRDAGIRMIHIGTDCVFDGKKGAYAEDDAPAPDDLYGRTKLIGEIDYPGCVTLRTSIIGHELEGQYGLIEWFLAEKGPVKGYTKAIYTGFPTIEFARVIHRYVIPAQDLSGLYHVSSEPINKFDLLHLVAKKYGKSIDIEPHQDISLDRSLRSDRFREKTGYMPPSWPELVNTMFEDYTANREQYESKNA
jgi:dTDP-4-dehydrorhamnose reductase